MAIDRRRYIGDMSETFRRYIGVISERGINRFRFTYHSHHLPAIVDMLALNIEFLSSQDHVYHCRPRSACRLGEKRQYFSDVIGAESDCCWELGGRMA
eukprot:1264240-Amorphochlora_amoeboformis.AAC.1